MDEYSRGGIPEMFRQALQRIRCFIVVRRTDRYTIDWIFISESIGDLIKQ